MFYKFGSGDNNEIGEIAFVKHGNSRLNENRPEQFQKTV